MIRHTAWGLACLIALATLGPARSAEPETPLEDLDLLGELQLLQALQTPATRPPGTPPTPPRPLLATVPTGSTLPPTRLAMIPRNLEPEMMGDFFVGRFGSIRIQSRVAPGLESLAVPGGSRSLKIADNESPRPQDRVYLAYNYFHDFGHALNRRLGETERFYENRGTFGIEKTLCDGNASIGLRVPLHSIETTDSDQGLNGTDTDVGDPSVILKYAVCNDCQTGNVLSVGLVVTAPTGEDEFNPFHGTVLQPWVGFIYRCGDCFLHGFIAVDVPTENDDSTLLFNDLGVGYFLYECADETQCVTAVVPMFEVHVNTPLNHRGALASTDPAGTSDTVDLTLATSVEFHRRARLSLGAITPVTGPRPFDVEIAAAFNLRF